MKDPLMRAIIVLEAKQAYPPELAKRVDAAFEEATQSGIAELYLIMAPKVDKIERDLNVKLNLRLVVE